MLTAEALADLVSKYNPKSNSAKIVEAYNYGQTKHEGQFRKSGEPYFTHPVSVAEILAEQRLDDATIITALLHDTIEDTGSTKQDISRLFSHEISELVDGVTKLTKIQLSSMETQEAENIRKLLMAVAQDIRVILVKLADRLHNMRTIKAMPRNKQQQKARETMDIFAPLAGRMGMQFIREDLEDLAFKILNPKGRESIIRRFINLQKDAGDVIQRISRDMHAEFGKEYIEAHHLIPLSSLPEGQTVSMDPREDFAVLCSNCHRIVHRKKDHILSLEELRNIDGVKKIREIHERSNNQQ